VAAVASDGARTVRIVPSGLYAAEFMDTLAAAVTITSPAFSCAVEGLEVDRRCQ
jgi:hypothetical protein